MVSDKRYDSNVNYNYNKFDDGSLHLRNYGYAIKKPENERRSALQAASQDYGWFAVVERLDQVRILQSKYPANQLILENDIEYMEQLHTNWINEIRSQFDNKRIEPVISNSEIINEEPIVNPPQSEVVNDELNVNNEEIVNNNDYGTYENINYTNNIETVLNNDCPLYEPISYTNNNSVQISYADENCNISYSTDKITNDNYNVLKMLSDNIIAMKNIKTQQMVLTNEYMRLRMELSKNYSNQS